MNNIAAYNLKLLRSFAQLSQQELAEQTNIPVEHIKTFERGEKKDCVNYSLLFCQFFKVSVSNFLHQKMLTDQIADIILTDEEIYGMLSEENIF